jgi:hypothetical protein
VQQPKSDLGRLNLEVCRSYTDTPHVVGLLWRSDQLVGKADTCTTHTVHKGRTSMPSAGFEPAISAIKRLQTYALDCTVTRIGDIFIEPYYECAWIMKLNAPNQEMNN